MPHSRYIPGTSFFLCLIAIVSLCIGKYVQAAEPVWSLYELRQRNVVLQQWDLSCAAAALATILRYQHGEPVTERYVALGLINRREYISNPEFVRIRQGFSLLDLKRFVEKIGYQGSGFGQMALADLCQKAPIIVPVNLQGFAHFVVFRGLARNTVLVADPAFGNLTMSQEKFLHGWIKYKDIGRVGFTVTKPGPQIIPNKLTPHDSDFIMLR